MATIVNIFRCLTTRTAGILYVSVLGPSKPHIILSEEIKHKNYAKKYRVFFIDN